MRQLKSVKICVYAEILYYPCVSHVGTKFYLGGNFVISQAIDCGWLVNWLFHAHLILTTVIALYCTSLGHSIVNFFNFTFDPSTLCE